MEKKRGLGRGLDALLGSDYNAKEEVRKNTDEEFRGGIFEINIDKIIPNKQQPRSEFDSEKIQELTQSIKELGVIQPITLRRLDRHQYQIISGERRYRAAKAAGLSFIPSFIREANDDQVFAMALVENIQREDLNPIEIALSYQKLINDYQITMDELAQKVSKQRSTVNNFLRLLKLPDFLQSALKESKISMGHARALINIDEIEHQKIALQNILEGGLSVRQVEQMVKKGFGKKPTTKTKIDLPIHFKQHKKALETQYHNKVNIKRNAKGAGSITLSFTSDDMLQEFLDKLK